MLSQSGSFVSLTRHDEFYLPGGDIYFLVENIQFRVHRYFFERESAFFKGKLVGPVSPGAVKQGTSDATAIVLDGVKAADFSKFLWVFYNPKYSLYDASVEDWEAILGLADQWAFPEVKALAVRELEKMEISDIDRIVIYHQHHVDRNLLIRYYASICEREEPLSVPEGNRLGMETSLMLASLREYARANLTPNGARSPSTPTVHGTALHNIVREIFGIASSDAEPKVATSSGGLLSTISGPMLPQELHPSSHPHLMLPTSPTAQLQQLPHPTKSQLMDHHLKQTDHPLTKAPPQTPMDTPLKSSKMEVPTAASRPPKESTDSTPPSLKIPNPPKHPKGKSAITAAKEATRKNNQVFGTGIEEANGKTDAVGENRELDRVGSEAEDTNELLDLTDTLSEDDKPSELREDTDIDANSVQAIASRLKPNPFVDFIDLDKPFGGDGSGDLGCFNASNLWSPTPHHTSDLLF